MRFYRDDCASLLQRSAAPSTFSAVYAKITKAGPPPVIKDEYGELEVTFNLRPGTARQFRVDDYGYFLFDLSRLPELVVLRATPAPLEIYPVALCQLSQAREVEKELNKKKSAEKDGCGVVRRVFETSQPAKSIEAAVEQSGATRSGTFKVDSVLYRSNLLQVSSFNLLHHSNFPNSSFVVATTPAEGKTQPPRATADQGFDLILDKLSVGLVPVQNTAFIVQGNEYHLKDFRLRIGTVTMGTTTKGVMVEVEYAPVSSAIQCSGLLTEFVETFFPGQSHKKPEALLTKSGIPENFSAIDILSQYLDIFNGMQRKA